MNELLRLNDVRKSYETNIAVNNVSFSVANGECLGLVGESGSGKSTIAKLILALQSVDQGSIIFQGEKIEPRNRSKLRPVRKGIQAIFQDPTAALNRKLPVWKSVIEPLENFPEVTPSFLSDVRESKKRTVERLFDMVGLSKQHIDAYPEQLSGGQKQRVVIARGISLGPQLLVCDEPTSSLDVSVQAQILNLLKRLKKETNMAFLFISHDISAVRFLSDRIVVLKNGQMVDQFQANELLAEDRHLYTRQLVQAVSYEK